MQIQEAAANATRNMAVIAASMPTVQEAGQGMLMLCGTLPEQSYQVPFLGQEWKDGKIHPIRRMDRVEWGFTIWVCLTFEMIPVMLAIQAWVSYGIVAGLAAALLPLAVLLWEIKVIYDRETKGK
jgi:hypothetical protein